MSSRKAGLERPYTAEEFLRIVRNIAEEKKLDYIDQLDYLLAEHDCKMTTDDADFRSDTHFGGCEGIYTVIKLVIDGRTISLFTAKTLGESQEDYIKMHVLAANLCLIARRYVDEHDDEFNWTGFDVYYVRDGKINPYMWCGKKENALSHARTLSDKGYDAIVRDNATREIIQGKEFMPSDGSTANGS